MNSTSDTGSIDNIKTSKNAASKPDRADDNSVEDNYTESSSDTKRNKLSSKSSGDFSRSSSSDSEESENGLEIKEKIEIPEVPQPKYLLPLCTYLGATAFMGYTACINAIDFFVERCPGYPDLSQNVARILNFCGLGAIILTFPFVEKIQAKLRILLAQFVYACCFLFFLIYPNIADTINITALYVIFAFDGFFFGVLMTSNNGFCGLLSKAGAPYAIIGNALAGIFSTVLRLVSKPIGHDGEGWFYFGICFAIILLGEIFLYLFTLTDYYKYRMQFAKKGLPLKERLQNIKNVSKKAWLEYLSVTLINCTSYIVFPGYATSCKIKHGLSRSWVTSIIIACYMFGDFVGRYATRLWKWPGPKYVWICVVLRFLFFILYCLPIENVIEVLNDEIWVAILSFLLSFSGGYFLNLSQIYTSLNSKIEKNELEISAFTLSFCIGFGTSVGNIISYAMPIDST